MAHNTVDKKKKALPLGSAAHAHSRKMAVVVKDSKNSSDKDNINPVSPTNEDERVEMDVNGHHETSALDNGVSAPKVGSNKVTSEKASNCTKTDAEADDGTHSKEAAAMGESK